MRRLVGLYPADWQARYGPEFEAILEARPTSVRDRVDILRGAIDARIHPQGPGAGDPSPAPVGLLPGVLLALGGLSWAIAALIVATARITPSGYLDAQAAAAFIWVPIITIPLGTSMAFGGLSSPVGRRGGALNAVFLVSVVAVWILPWPILGVAMILTVVFFSLSGFYHVIVAARFGWVPRGVAAIVVVVTTAGVAGFTWVVLLGLGGPGSTASDQEMFRLLYTVVVGPFGLAWALVGAFMARRSRTRVSPAATGVPGR